MGDVGEGAAVDDGRVVLERLHEVRLQRLAQQHGHGAGGVQLARLDGTLAAGVADHDVPEALLEIVQAGREAEDSHHLGGDNDVETVLPRIPVAGAAKGAGDIAQGAVVHVHHTLPRDAAHVDIEGVTVMDMVVDECRKQVVGKADGVEIAGEVEVDVLHGHDLRHAAAGRTALHAEDRAEARLTQTDERFLADLVQCIAQTDRGGGLALAGRRGADGGHKNQLAVRTISQAVDVVECDLRLVLAVLIQ